MAEILLAGRPSCDLSGPRFGERIAAIAFARAESPRNANSKGKIVR